MQFSGNFALLPFAANVRYGVVPEFPTSAQFHAAVSRVQDDLAVHPEAHWFIEAVRERRMNPARSLNDARQDISVRVARRLYDLARSE